jgi:hypothetical protein
VTSLSGLLLRGIDLEFTSTAPYLSAPKVLTYPKAFLPRSSLKIGKKSDSGFVFFTFTMRQQQHLVSTSTTAKSFVTSGTTPGTKPSTTPTNTLSKIFGSFRLLKT